jgi:hypothetical protein
MSRVTKLETYRGYQKQVVWKTTKDHERIQDPQSSVENMTNSIPRQVLNMSSPLRLVHIWRGYLHYLSACDLMFIPCVRGGSQINFTFTIIFTLPSTDSNVCL